jgi:hypothetical protein
VAPDQSHTVAAGHTGKIARGRGRAEMALRAFVEDWRDRLLVRFFWRAVDALDYLVTFARLRVVDAVAGPEPETPADQQRKRSRWCAPAWYCA